MTRKKVEKEVGTGTGVGTLHPLQPSIDELRSIQMAMTQMYGTKLMLKTLKQVIELWEKERRGRK